MPRSRLFAQDLLDLNLQVLDVPEDLSDLEDLFKSITLLILLEPLGNRCGAASHLENVGGSVLLLCFLDW